MLEIHDLFRKQDKIFTLIGHIAKLVGRNIPKTQSTCIHDVSSGSYNALWGDYQSSYINLKSSAYRLSSFLRLRESWNKKIIIIIKDCSLTFSTRSFFKYVFLETKGPVGKTFKTEFCSDMSEHFVKLVRYFSRKFR